MLLISYDIQKDKLRTKFCKFIKKYGYRLQYSVYRINNSDRILRLIMSEIEDKFEPSFSETDSIMIYNIYPSAEVVKYGYAKHQDDDMIIVD